MLCKEISKEDIQEAVKNYIIKMGDSPFLVGLDQNQDVKRGTVKDHTNSYTRHL